MIFPKAVLLFFANAMVVDFASPVGRTGLTALGRDVPILHVNVASPPLIRPHPAVTEGQSMLQASQRLVETPRLKTSTSGLVSERLATPKLNFDIVGPMKNDAPAFTHLPQQYHEMAGEMIKVSSNAYYSGEKEMVGYRLFAKNNGFVTDDFHTVDPVSGDLITVSGTTKESNWLGYKIFTKPTENGHEIIVAFRGSQSPSDFGTNSDFALSPLSLNDRAFGQVHSGFMKAYMTVRPAYLKDLEAAKNALGENVKVSVTGHSLGGALATLSAVDLERNFNHLYSVKNLYTFGSPRIGDSMFEDIVQKSLVAHGGADVVRVAALDRNGYADMVAMIPPTQLGYSDPKIRYSITDKDANCPGFTCRLTTLHNAYFG